MLPRPHIPDADAYTAVYTDARVWRPYVDAILMRHGLPAAADLRAGVPGTNAVFLIDGRYAVKLYPNLFEGTASEPVERQVYTSLATAPAIAAPTLVAHGNLFADDSWHWPYIVTTVIGGASLDEAEGLPSTDRIALATWLGSQLRQIHALRLVPGPLNTTWPPFVQFIRKRRAVLVADHARWQSLPPALIAQLEAYVPQPDELVDQRTMPALLHADLNADHILGERIGGRWTPRGIIDFGDACVGDPLYELGALHLGTFGGDPHLLATFLESYDPKLVLQPGFVRRALSMILLHRFNVCADLAQQRPELIQSPTLDDLGRALLHS